MVDSIDNNRDEDRRAEIKRSELRQSDQKKVQERAGKDFKAQIEAKEKNKEINDQRMANKDSEKHQEGLLNKILQTFQKKEDSDKQQSHEFNKKEDDKKDQKAEQSSSKSKSSDVTDTHKRVEGQHQSSQDQDDRGGGQRGRGGFGGSSSDGEKGSQSGFGGGSSKSFSQQQNESDLAGSGKIKNSKSTGVFGENTVLKMGREGNRQSMSKDFSNEDLDQLVESVRVGMNIDGEREMEVKLTDDYFAGLKIKVTKTAAGMVVTFYCPNASIKSSFLIQKSKIVLKLAGKNIKIARVDIL